jgi:hypothetical protein
LIDLEDYFSNKERVIVTTIISKQYEDLLDRVMILQSDHVVVPLQYHKVFLDIYHSQNQ